MACSHAARHTDSVGDSSDVLAAVVVVSVVVGVGGVGGGGSPETAKSGVTPRPPWLWSCRGAVPGVTWRKALHERPQSVERVRL